MKKGCIVGLIIGSVFVLFILIALLWGIKVYNNLVSMNEAVTSQWGNVEAQYQRRMDLIPNFVNTVKGAANFEQQTLNQVIEARSKASSVTIDPSNLSEEAIARFQEAQGEVSSALNRLMVVVERYPDIKATQNYRDLQVALEGTENRIAVERRKFNEVAQAYNAYLKKFPQNIIASMFGFQPKGYFKSAEGAEKAPEVKF
ncbi:MAG TPA: LemA family protein [Bacteroidales bacterium]|nr:LemA family protein [Bacteroidales bacterium]HRC88675.1 LemA family protein [Bacteroidales bacterium]